MQIIFQINISLYKKFDSEVKSWNIIAIEIRRLFYFPRILQIHWSKPPTPCCEISWSKSNYKYIQPHWALKNLRSRYFCLLRRAGVQNYFVDFAMSGLRETSKTYEISPWKWIFNSFPYGQEINLELWDQTEIFEIGWSPRPIYWLDNPSFSNSVFMILWFRRFYLTAARSTQHKITSTKYPLRDVKF